MKTNPDKYFGPGKIEASPKDYDKFIQFKFSSISHFLGYEGRCGAPTRFDAAYTFNLGLIAGSLILGGQTGYMAGLSGLDQGGQPVAIPLTSLMSSEQRGQEVTVVIQKALVNVDSAAFKYFSNRRQAWADQDIFSNPGPIQYYGPTANQIPIVVALNQGHSSLNFNIGGNPPA
jgi:pyrophosphate--fructose-6-phosphate 1-phosphotransferase